MSQAFRTTLILGAFWFLVIIAGIYLIHFQMRSEEEELLNKEQKAKEQLQLSLDQVHSIPAIQEELEEVKSLWAKRSKEIPKVETAYETYRYLDKILSQEKTTLNFDYFATERSDSNGIYAANYRIKGEAKFIDLYRFIWYIENLPRYLRINSLELTETPMQKERSDARKNWVVFDLSITALSADRPGLGDIEFATDVKPPETSYDPFVPLFKARKRIPPNTRGLPDVFNSSLRALTPTQIYILDQAGKLKILKLGDEVYLGRLAAIIPEENRAVFELNQLHPPKQISLVIGAENKKSTR